MVRPPLDEVSLIEEHQGRAFDSLKSLLSSGRPLIYVCSPEEGRIRSLLLQAARQLFRSESPLWTWSLTEGLLPSDGKRTPSQPSSARAVLDFIATHEKPGIFHLKDFHPFLQDSPEIRRRLRDLYDICLDKQKIIVMSSPLRLVPEEVGHQVALLELRPPDLEELITFVGSEMETLAAQGHAVDRGDRAVDRIARSLQGLTIDESRHAIRRAVAGRHALDGESIPLLLEEKKLAVNKSGLVQYVSDGTQLNDVGGLEYLKKWLTARRKLFLERDSLASEIVPKGVLVMGVSGCGKSLSVKAIASCFELPLYRIDMIEVFSGKHGNADHAFVEACKVVESVAPAVVWFDEIEMGLTAQTGEASNDLGRIFAFFLTWMQEKPRGLFVAATANRIDLLPAEMIRKGRFDEVFFVDLPTDSERIEILSIHLRRRRVDPTQLEVSRLKGLTQGWTGAELEQCVISALTAARLEDRTVTFNDLLGAAQRVVPLSKTMREQVNHIRSWAFDRAVRASPRDSDA